MKKTITLLAVLLTMLCGSRPEAAAQTREIKNVILMIPDGVSPGVITMARWYKAARDGKTGKGLCFDSLCCGMVMTHTSDGEITGSASAATAMSTGQKTHSDFIGLSPDTVPLITTMELARLKGKATGLVFTCQFPHATPAGFVSHCAYRSDYKTIKKQMMHNQIDVVFGGGYGGPGIFGAGDRKTLESLGYSFCRRFEEVDNVKSKKVWGLFNSDTNCYGYLAFDLDRRTLGIPEPSLAQMTQKAIQKLERNPNGFFLMVEGSLVDWAAHGNDAIGTVTEFLAFEEAVQVALDYARKNKNTVVIICTDHCNGGFSVGNHWANRIYTDLKYDSIAGLLLQYNITGDGFERLIEKKDHANHDTLRSYFSNLFPGFNFSQKTDSFITAYFKKRGNNRTLAEDCGLNEYISKYSYIGWTSTGHTGDDVPLFIYHPDNITLHGLVNNSDIAHYIAEMLGMGIPGDKASKKYFSEYVPKAAAGDEIKGDTLICKRDKAIYRFVANSNVYFENDKKTTLETLLLRISNKFYLPEEALEIIK